MLRGEKPASQFLPAPGSGATLRGTDIPVRQHLLVLALLLLGELLIFRGQLFQGAALYYQVIRDPNPNLLSSSWYLSHAQALGHGAFPLWNPWNGFGAPLIANYQSGFFSPLLAPLFLLPLSVIAVPYLLLRLLLAGWGTYLYGRGLGFRHWPATLAALGFAFSGWMIQYVNNQTLAIDLLLPFLFWSLDRLFQRRVLDLSSPRPECSGPKAEPKGRLWDSLLLTGIVLLTLLGGQPSSALFTLTTGLAYALWLHLRRPRDWLCLAIPLGLAGAASLAQTLPFLEYLPHSWTYHPVGFGLQHLPLATAITLLAPGFFGFTGDERLPVMMTLPYLGAVPLALALAAVLRPRRLSSAAGFFAVTALVSLGFLHGLPGFRQIMALPGLNRLTFFKYCQPLLTFAVAILAGFAADRIQPRERRLGGGLALLGLLAALALGWHWFPEARSVRLLSCGLAAAVLLAGWFLQSRPAWLALLAGLGLIGDAQFNTPLPLPWLKPRDLSFLAPFRSQAPDYPRLAASEDVFPPNHGVPWQVDDLRVTDGIFVARGISFQNLLNHHSPAQGLDYLLPYNYTRVAPDPDRFGGPLGSLARLRWYLSREPLPPNTAVDEVLAQARGLAPGPEFIARTAFEVQGDFRRVLYEHPPARLEIPAAETREHRGLQCGLALDPGQWSQPGDGVWFAALAAGKLTLARQLNPARRPSDRRWVDLSFGFPGPGPAELVTLPGPSREHDWAGWGDLRWQEERVSRGRLEHGVRVHENPRAFPPAFLVGAWTEAANAEDSARWMRGAGMLRLQAVIEGAPASGGQGGEPAGRVEGVEKSEGALALTATAGRDSLLVISESYFPGWQARRNGQPVRIYPADLAFRGVLVPAGTSRVEMVYRPWAFRLGLWASLATIIGTVTIIAFRPKTM